MKIIVGLGNPGKEYEKTRHNCGFMAIYNLQKTLNENFDNFKFNKKFDALISQGDFNKEKIVLAMPQTFMNNSGKSVSALMNYYKLNSSDLFIINDDIDLPIIKIKISKNINSAGHKGVQSIIDYLETKAFIRFRIGIKPIHIYNTKEFVLQEFTKEQEKNISENLEKITLAIKMTLKEGINNAMNKYN
ncbi:aminoacyl-tRNA hydrolase [Candidatus Kuenenbacteria bacterium HGW-Kuenenbacteria-1]|uniref:Peptidyl-tRNA hydrolase n=1 Tax=Candidatus Kuenenbacteria bacterium HGW-Kuenenbacteria-1 TaxID=2013812 RepID=A0A2N1UP14_9BACT|nr:MAG: aminoacyl-tRNA hydrolase [Candidatus Kuenenbacteria bacterium HGW-Kuenenbacteria-1]